MRFCGLLLPFVLMLFTQCTSSQVVSDSVKPIEQLGLCLEFAPHIPIELQEQFETSLDQYIINYNNEPHAFKLTDCQSTSSLYVRIEDVTYTTQNERASGFLVSALGIVGLPVLLASSGSPIILGFYYFPRNATIASSALSSDIAHFGISTQPKRYETFGLFGSDLKQRQKHAKNFDMHFNMLLKEVEKNYVRSMRKMQKIALATKTE